MYKSTVVCLLAVAVLALGGCATTHARYKEQEYGPRVQGSMEEAVSNIKKMMSMPPEQMKKAMMQGQQEAIARGKELFNDPNTGHGTKGLSCNSCHPGGGTTGGETEIPKRMGHGPYKLPIPSLVVAAAHFPKYKIPNDEVISLQQMNNNCIRMFMDGKRLELDSPESYYLAAYVTSLSNGEVIEVGK